MDELIKQLHASMEVVIKKIESRDDEIESAMNKFRTDSFDIQAKLYRISQHSWTEDFCGNIRRLVYTKFQSTK